MIDSKLFRCIFHSTFSRRAQFIHSLFAVLIATRMGQKRPHFFLSSPVPRRVSLIGRGMTKSDGFTHAERKKRKNCDRGARKKLVILLCCSRGIRNHRSTKIAGDRRVGHKNPKDGREEMANRYARTESERPKKERP